MNKTLPDKWIRKAIYDAINNAIVVNLLTEEVVLLENIDGDNINTGGGSLLSSTPWISVPCYDTRVTANGGKNHYVLMTTQTNTVNKDTKCDNSWESSILLDIVTSFSGAGNTGSRLLADSILDKVRELTDVLVLDANSGLKIITQTQDFPNDLSTITTTENIFRKFMRIELFIV